MEELLTDPVNQLQSSDTTGSIAWSTDDVFAKVMGKERKGCIRGVGFGPNPSGRSRSALTDLHIQSRDNEVAQLKEELSTMKEKLTCFDQMQEKLRKFEDMEETMACILEEVQHSSHGSQVLHFNVP